MLCALLLAVAGSAPATAQTGPDTVPDRTVEQSADRPTGDRAAYSASSAPSPRQGSAGDARMGVSYRAGMASQDTTRVTFNDAIRIALDQNTDLKRAMADVRQAEAQVWAEGLDFAPEFSISAGGSREFGQTFVREQGSFIDQTTDFFRISGDSRITVFDGMANFSTLKQARAQSRASELSLSRTRQDVVFEVMNRYITLVENREILRVQREELQARRQQLAQIQEFVDAGSRPVSALYEQQANVAEQETSVLQAERDVQIAETRLIQVMQLDPVQAYDFQAPSLPESLSVEEYDLSELLSRARQRRLDLRSAEASLQAAEHNVRTAKASYFPSVSLGFGYGSNWSSSPRSGEPEAFFDLLDVRKNGRFSLGVDVPIFQGLRRNAQVERAQAQAQNRKYDLQDQRQQIVLQVRQTFFDYRNAVQQLQASESRLRAARQARQAAQERYNLGAASIVELTNANRNFVEAASQRIRARYNLVFQKKLIDYYVGVLNPQEALFQ